MDFAANGEDDKSAKILWEDYSQHLNGVIFSKLTSFSSPISCLGNSLNVVKGMPCLKKVSLWDEAENFNWEYFIDDVFSNTETANICDPFESIRTFSCGYPFVSNLSFEKLSSWFVNLKRLEVAFTDSSIRVVFANMKNLQELVVLERHLTDDGICGKPCSLEIGTAWNPQQLRQYPYIGDMKSIYCYAFLMKFFIVVRGLLTLHAKLSFRASYSDFDVLGI